MSEEVRQGEKAMQTINQTPRRVHLDALRLIAVLAVLFNHTADDGFFLFSVSQGSVFYGLYLFLSVGCKFAVPVFFMVSGALLLPKKEQLRVVWTRRIPRFAAVLVVAGVLYRLWLNGLAGLPSTVPGVLGAVYAGQGAGALWYLYAYLALLMMLPFLRAIAQGCTGGELVYLAGASFVFTALLPAGEYLLTGGALALDGDLQGTLFLATPIVWFLMGYYLEHRLPRRFYDKKYLPLALAAALAAVIACCALTQYEIELTGVCNEGASQRFYAAFGALPAYAVYYCTKLWFAARPAGPRTAKGLQVLGGAAFGVYLLDRFLRSYTHEICVVLRPLIGALPACFVWVLATWGLGTAATLLLKRLPVIRKLL